MVYKNQHINLLFRKDRYSNSQPLYEKIGNHELIEDILINVDRSQPKQILKLKDVSNSSNYILIYRHRTLVLKQEAIASYKNTLDQINFAHEISRYVSTITYQKFQNGELLITDNKNVFSLQSFINGHHNNGSYKDYAQTMDCIRNYYAKHKNIAGKLEGYELEEIELDDFSILFFELLEKLHLNDSEEILLKKKCLLEKENILQITGSISKNNLTKICCHIDLHPQNIILGNDDENYIIDLDSFKLHNIEIAISFAIFKNYRNLISHLKIPKTDIYSILEEGIEIVFCSKKPVALVLSLALQEYLRRANYILAELELLGSSKWQDDLRIQLLGILEILYCYKLGNKNLNGY